jgi:CheY-like chemotaxis protein
MTQKTPSTPAEASAASPVRVLIVDDDLLILAILKDIVSKLPGFVCVGEGTDGEEAIERSAELSPDIILMDIVMPKLSGIEAARRISARRISALTNPPKIIICSSMSGEEIIEDAHAAGIVAYLKKPPTALSVLEALKKALG